MVSDLPVIKTKIVKIENTKSRDIACQDLYNKMEKHLITPAEFIERLNEIFPEIKAESERAIKEWQKEMDTWKRKHGVAIKK